MCDVSNWQLRAGAGPGLLSEKFSRLANVCCIWLFVGPGWTASSAPVSGQGEPNNISKPTAETVPAQEL